MGSDWRPHWGGRDRYVIFASAWCETAFRRWVGHWQADPARPRRLHVIAVAGGPLPGFARMLQDDAAITLDLLHAAPLAALAQLQARIDAVELGEAALAELARPLARLLSLDAVLQAPALDPAAWQALAATGWLRDGAGVVRFATRKPIAPPPPPPTRCAIVIGAGLAGAAACERLCARGWQVTLLERHPAAAMEASGNLAGITMPLLSKDDNLASRLSRAAFLFARAYWQRLGGVGAAIEGARCGVLLAARDPDHAALQRAIAAARALPPDYAAWFDGAAAGHRFGAIAPHGAWLFAGGGWIRPGSAVAAMLAACGDRLDARFGVGEVSLRGGAAGWQAHGADGHLVASAASVIIASGAGALAQSASLPLERVRGQVTHLAPGTAPDLGLVLCREAYLTPAGAGWHCAGATYDDDADPALRWSSQQQNLANLRSMLADERVAPAAPLAGRVGFRAVAPDRLPMVGAVPESAHAAGTERLRELPRQPGVYALLAYASRGLTWAPLAAELLAASLEGEPLPLEGELVAALDPGRFLLRARRSRPAGLR
ncbi:FAD-dependent 5-carboxymethylaminomethyl-2-thiouridine(34) oxidoreductase MnmC [Massilia sp. DWR3-1-1]|uniref:FAD-dependent 5-carboxymethylaminomethyl-2-thiouridine(34) oxidoreductase MnmC n=1 Tax=Massilia sp. DWR3-1-1 TaxID=2804559 RepID=UPI003CF3A9C0